MLEFGSKNETSNDLEDWTPLEPSDESESTVAWGFAIALVTSVGLMWKLGWLW